MSRITGYSAAAMTVTLQERIVLNNKDYGSEQSFIISNVANVDRRIMNITDTESTIYTTGAAMGPGTYIAAKVQYIRITNLDDAKNVILTIANENDDEMAIVLHENQKSFMLVADGALGMVDMFDANQNALSFTDATCDYNDDPTIACDSSVKITPGLFVAGTGIPAGAYVSSVNTAGAVTSFELSASTTDGSVTNGTLTFTPGLGDIKSITADCEHSDGADIEIFIAEIA